jgi:hypothetical protein
VLAGISQPGRYAAALAKDPAGAGRETHVIQVAILTRRLKEGRTYEDFRRAWFHTTGFGTGNRMYTVVNAFDPREIIVLGLTEITLEDFSTTLEIDVNERLDHSLDDVIEPEVGRTFGLLVSEDDFSAEGEIEYVPPAVGGLETDLDVFARDLDQVATLIGEASARRDRKREERKMRGS